MVHLRAELVQELLANVSSSLLDRGTEESERKFDCPQQRLERQECPTCVSCLFSADAVTRDIAR
jgi:hypothetical protein